jgi:predicted DNA-binding transcriptional regulator AlpA
MAQKLNLETELAAAASCDDALLRLRTVCALTGLATTPMKKRIAMGDFPAPVRLGSTTHRWRAGDVRGWIRAQSDTRAT